MLTLFLLSTAAIVVAYPTGYTLGQTGTGFAELSTEQYYSPNRAVKMGTITTTDRGEIAFNGGPKLSEISTLSYCSSGFSIWFFNKLR